MICEYCGRTFKPRSKFHPNQKYCSEYCQQTAWKKTHPERWRQIALKGQKKYAKDNCEVRNRYRNRKYLFNKQKALKYKGGCVVCGSTDDLVYHHLDPNEKVCNMALLFRSNWKKIKVELDKCIPMCVGLHDSLHRELKIFTNILKKNRYNLKIRKEKLGY